MNTQSATKTLVVGWPSFLHGEATAGDVMSMRVVADELEKQTISHAVAWSDVMATSEISTSQDMTYGAVQPNDFSHVVFVCGPLSGEPVAELHEKFSHCVRIAVGVSVVNGDAAAAHGFHTVLARDGRNAAPRRDLSAAAPTTDMPVIGVLLTEGQDEYGCRRRHDDVRRTITEFVSGMNNTLGSRVAAIPLDTRLDPRDWRMSTSSEQLEAILRRVDVVLTMRLHGMVLALRNGVPAVAVDPVAGGAKVSAQAAAWGWPGVLAGETATVAAIADMVRWALTDDAKALAGAANADTLSVCRQQLDALTRTLRGTKRA